MSNLTATHDMAVSNQWANRPDDQRFTSLDGLWDAMETRKRGSREVRSELRDLAVMLNDEGNDLRLHVPALTQDAEFTHYSFGTLANRAGAPAGYLRSLPVELAAECLNHGIQDADNDKIMPYVYQNGHTELRAATSPTYGRIYDADVVKAVKTLNERDNGRWKVPGVLDWGTHTHNPHVDITKENTTLYASDRDVFMFLCDDAHPIQVGTLPNGEPDMMFRGFYVWNSETGNASFGIATMYMRAVCQNRILWGVEGKKEISFRHSSNAPQRFLNEARPMLRQFAECNTQRLIAGVEASKENVLPDDRADKIKWIMKETGVTQARAIGCLNAVEKEEHRVCRSVWDVAQGLTAIARRVPHQDQRIDLERAAKKILDKVSVH